MAFTLLILQSSKATSSRKSPRLPPIQQLPLSWNYYNTSHSHSHLIKNYGLSTYYVPGLARSHVGPGETKETQPWFLFPMCLQVCGKGYITTWANKLHSCKLREAWEL